MTNGRREPGTVADLLEFLNHASHEPNLHPATMQAVRSAWRSVTQELQISSARFVAELKPDDMVDSFESRRGPNFRSGTTYRTRLRVGQQLYLAWLSGDPEWTVVARTRIPGGSRGLNRSEASRAALRTVEFPLRRDMMINIEVPYDLSATEADRVSGFLRSLVIPDEEPPPG